MKVIIVEGSNSRFGPYRIKRKNKRFLSAISGLSLLPFQYWVSCMFVSYYAICLILSTHSSWDSFSVQYFHQL